MRLGVLASGSGTNLQAIIDAVEAKKLPAEIAVVVSDNAQAPALERARKHRYKHICLNPRNYKGREEYDAALVSLLQRERVGLVVLAGFMRLLSRYFVREYEGRITNIHPSLLPAFPGLNAVQQALKYGVKITGCTVHFVDEGVDTGPIIAQVAVAVKEGDTVETLHQRIHSAEHKLYPWALGLICRGKVRVEGRRCIISD
ncbi:MAG: phosphoribosylglycinamide formyltransferase [Firmicutes bacterium]|nr:phosphoribosylglycinamide formyltransferase [Bacillota bacterium]